MTCSYDEQMLSAFCFAGILAFALITLLPQLPAYDLVWVSLTLPAVLLLGVFVFSRYSVFVFSRSSFNDLFQYAPKLGGAFL